MNKYQKIYENIKFCFDQLWTFKYRGDETIEIITPYSTTSNKFVSLFLTKRENKFIVTDGGLLNSEVYESKVDYDNQCLLKILYHFENHYQIKTTIDKKGYKHYYKTTTSEMLIPNLIYDMAQFISMCVSSATVEFDDLQEKEEKETFRKNANAFLESIVSKDDRKFGAYLDKENYRTVRFSAIIERRSRLSLISYVTGSNITNYANSIARTNLNFEIASSSKYSSYIDNKIVLMNDNADGYVPKSLYNQINILKQNTNDEEPIKWSEKEKLKKLLNPNSALENNS
ncbi:hypothetical protein [Flavobacterium sp. GSP6]|uniref:hypothetical protein n=1 Tax=Flavobacterium sp. GSP6 TaxID=2497488 RepID=UPI000F878C8B|nr:hypothetical protein [Flavobacterium sp. GSP6]RTZ04796.1 hypothetical protein EKM03_10750 [Flavobacterium sp. GSP6]